MIPTALTIAGSDSGGGAGIQADLKTFLAHGVYGMSAITALTAQNTTGVTWVGPTEIAGVRAQIRAVFDDLPVGAVKIGMLGTREIALAVAEELAGRDVPVVLDPVAVATSGARLIDDEAIAVLRDVLGPACTLITPNLPELAALGGVEWAKRCGTAVLVKGGHAEGPVVVDRLLHPDGTEESWHHQRLASRNTHGTGCTLSSAIAARLAKGQPLPVAVWTALDWLHALVRRSADHDLGSGHGPLLHGL